jgi:hypothetical protein
MRNSEPVNASRLTDTNPGRLLYRPDESLVLYRGGQGELKSSAATQPRTTASSCFIPPGAPPALARRAEESSHECGDLIRCRVTERTERWNRGYRCGPAR